MRYFVAAFLLSLTLSQNAFSFQKILEPFDSTAGIPLDGFEPETFALPDEDLVFEDEESSRERLTEIIDHCTSMAAESFFVLQLLDDGTAVDQIKERTIINEVGVDSFVLMHKEDPISVYKSVHGVHDMCVGEALKEDQDSAGFTPFGPCSTALSMRTTIMFAIENNVPKEDVLSLMAKTGANVPRNVRLLNAMYEDNEQKGFLVVLAKSGHAHMACMHDMYHAPE